MCPTLTGQQSPQKKSENLLSRPYIISKHFLRLVWGQLPDGQILDNSLGISPRQTDYHINVRVAHMLISMAPCIQFCAWIYEFPLAGQSQFVKTPDKETSHWHFWGRRDLNIFWTRSRTFFILWDLYSSATYSPVDLFKDRSKDQLSFFPCPPTWVKLTSSNVFTISRLELKNEALGSHHLTKLTLSTSEHSQHWRLNLKPVGMNL